MGELKQILLYERCIGLILNATCIIILYKYPKRTNQNIILLSLSTAELLILLCKLIVHFHPEQVILTTLASLRIEVVLIMFILTLDRLICVIDPSKHQSRLTEGKVKTLVFVTWIISTATLGLQIISTSFFLKVATLFLGGISGIYLLFVICTYIAIVIKIKQSREQFGESRDEQSKTFKKQFLIPTIIICVFVFLYMVPGFILAYILQYSNENSAWNVTLYKEICLFLQGLGLIMDPIVYVLPTKQYRDMIMRCWLTRINGKRTVNRSTAQIEIIP